MKAFILILSLMFTNGEATVDTFEVPSCAVEHVVPVASDVIEAVEANLPLTVYDVSFNCVVVELDHPGEPA